VAAMHEHRRRVEAVLHRATEALPFQCLRHFAQPPLSKKFKNLPFNSRFSKPLLDDQNKIISRAKAKIPSPLHIEHNKNKFKGAQNSYDENSRSAGMREHRPCSRCEEPRSHQHMRDERGGTSAPTAPRSCRTWNAERRRHACEDERQTDKSEHAFPRLVIGELESLTRRAAYAFRLSP